MTSAASARYLSKWSLVKLQKATIYETTKENEL